MVATSRRGKHRMAHRRRLLAVPLAVVTIAAGVVQSQAPPSHAEAAGRSDFCHVTDGTFTACPDGHREWADVPAKAFAAEHAFLYAYQVELDAAGGDGYSPDPLFWGGTAPPPDQEQPPVAVDDEGDIDIHGGQHDVTVNVVANDIDSDDTGVAPSTVQIGRGPQHGTVAVGADGSVVF